MATKTNSVVAVRKLNKKQLRLEVESQQLQNESMKLNNEMLRVQIATQKAQLKQMNKINSKGSR